MNTIYDINSSSVFLLQYHLILVIKHRKEVIDAAISSRLKEIFEYIAKRDQFQLTITSFDYDVDHLHIMFKAVPKSEISKFINAYKSASSRLIKKEFPTITTKLSEDSFWSKSFFLASVGEVNTDTFKEYINKQGYNNK